MRLRPISAIAAVLLATAASGCASSSGTGAPPIVAMKCPTIPTIRAEPHPDPLPPVSATKLTMAPGHWEWADGSYAWAPPEWVPRPEGRSPMWQDGFWTPNGGACVWTPGHLIF